jgi:hypothetical protein
MPDILTLRLKKTSKPGHRKSAGGVVSGHDYYEFPSGKGGVIPAVDEYVAKHGYRIKRHPVGQKPKLPITDNLVGIL